MWMNYCGNKWRPPKWEKDAYSMPSITKHSATITSVWQRLKGCHGSGKTLKWKKKSGGKFHICSDLRVLTWGARWKLYSFNYKRLTIRGVLCNCVGEAYLALFSWSWVGQGGTKNREAYSHWSVKSSGLIAAELVGQISNCHKWSGICPVYIFTVSWLQLTLNNTGLNCTSPLICGFFFNKYV